MHDISKIHPAVGLLLASVAGLAAATAQAGGLLDLEFEDVSFSTPLTIDNPYWPLLPAGVSFRSATYVGETEDECVIDTVSATAGDTKTLSGGIYSGFMAQVVRDEEWAVEDCATAPTDDDRVELTFDWYAQDDYGNIWYLGEDSRSFEDECPSAAVVPVGAPPAAWPSEELYLECTEGSWEAGQYGPEDEILAEAGIVVPSDSPYGPAGEPLSSGTFYMQELAESAEDMAKVLRLSSPVSIETGDFAGEHTGCRTVKEWTPLEPGQSVEHKHYCPNLGLLLVEGIGGGPTEVEIMVEMTTTP